MPRSCVVFRKWKGLGVLSPQPGLQGWPGRTRQSPNRLCPPPPPKKKPLHDSMQMISLYTICCVCSYPMNEKHYPLQIVVFFFFFSNVHHEINRLDLIYTKCMSSLSQNTHYPIWNDCLCHESLETQHLLHHVSTKLAWCTPLQGLFNHTKHAPLKVPRFVRSQCDESNKYINYRT